MKRPNRISEDFILIKTEPDRVIAVFEPTGRTICGCVYLLHSGKWENYGTPDPEYDGGAGNREHVEMHVLNCATGVLSNRSSKRSWSIRNVPACCPICRTETVQEPLNFYRCGAFCGWEQEGCKQE